MVVDEPNVDDQAHATYATGIVRNILTEVLPYMHISKTEEMTIAEQAEADAALGASVQKQETETTEGEEQEGGSSEGAQGESGEAAQQEEEAVQGPIYVVDPNTGELIDSLSGLPAEQVYSYEGDEDTQEGENQPAEE